MAEVFKANQVVVLGGGLSGVSAANTVIEFGGNAVLLDKSAFCGGNSTKATSGINGANTSTQREQKIEDTAQIFFDDIMKGGAKKPDIAKVLADKSGVGVQWLIDEFKLDLTLLARLGGHSMPRTHRGKERFPGMTITYALIQMLENIEKNARGRSRIVCKARAHTLIQNAGAVIGVKYEKAGVDHQEMGPVIVCTGGFGADFTNDSLLAKHRPDLMHLPTTNGEHCTGDGLKMCMAAGGNTLDLEWVQVHPTGLVKLDEPDAKVKFLAAEALRGVGGLVFDREGKRFANELGRRDYVTGEMWKGKAPFRLALNEAAAKEIHWHCMHYTGRGVMKHYKSGAELAKDMGIDVKVLEEQHQQHYEAAQKQEKDPEGGPYPAYPNGKTWDVPSGKTGVGKKFFHNILPGNAVATQEFFVAFITPVIHYCMGGVEIDEQGACVGTNGKPIPGLYVAGEASGGVHGNNRLGGNALLECVVFGRQAGEACAEYIGLGKNKETLHKLAGCYPGEEKPAEKSGGAVAKKGGDKKKAAAGISMAEVAKHTTEQDCWVVVNGQVLDVTTFLGDHPGGKLAILTFAGKDATAEFNMVHPPGVVEKYLDPTKVLGGVGEGGGEADAGGDAVAAAPKGPTLHPAMLPDEEDWSVKGWCGAVVGVVFLFVMEILKTIIFIPNYLFFQKEGGDRSGLTRSAVFLIVFMLIHAVGNLHIFLGPDDFCGYGFFYVRLYWTGLGLEANIVEEYVALCAIMHVLVALKRTYQYKSLSMMLSPWKNWKPLQLIITGLILLVYMTIHLQQFRFAPTETFYVRPPKYGIDPTGINPFGDHFLNFFWTTDTSIDYVGVRDIYKLELELFKSEGWCAFYLLGTFCFVYHMITGWNKLVGSVMGIKPSRHWLAKIIGAEIAIIVGLIYASFVFYAYIRGDYLLDYYYPQNIAKKDLPNPLPNFEHMDYPWGGEI